MFGSEGFLLRFNMCSLVSMCSVLGFLGIIYHSLSSDVRRLVRDDCLKYKLKSVFINCEILNELGFTLPKFLFHPTMFNNSHW